MVRRAATAAGALLLVVVAAVSVVVIGIRTKYPPLLNRIRRFNRDVGNPRQMRSAGTPGANASVLRHTGRKSGREYRTPVTAIWTADGFVIGLPYGPDTDWLRNILASGSAVLVHEGQSYRCDRPEVLATTEVAADLSARERRILRLMGVEESLRLHRVGPADAP